MISSNLRELGETGLEVSRIGLGLAALARPGYINLGHGDDLKHNYDIDVMQEHTNTVLDCALKHGVRYFDLARSYGLSEAFLSAWLKSRSLAIGDLTIGSKWGYTYTAGWEVKAKIHELKEHSIENLNKQYNETIGLLGKHLNIYQIHSATLQSKVLENEAVLDRLSELKNQGLFIGLSSSGAKQSETIEQALRIEYAGKKLFDTVQSSYNMLEPSASKSLKLAKSEGLGVIIKEALANGRLTTRNHAPAFADKLKSLKQQAMRLGTTVDALAIAYVLQQPWVDTVLSGAATVEQLESNMMALDVEIDDIALNALNIAEVPELYWSIRSNMIWN